MLHTSNVVNKDIKSRTMISKKQNAENEAFKVVFTLIKIKLIENSKIKIKLTETKF